MNFVFVLHAAIAAAIAFGLLFFVKPMSLFLIDGLDLVPWPTGALEDALEAYARLTAVGLVGIAIVTSLARVSAHSATRRPALIAMVALGLVFIALSFFLPGRLDAFVLWINVGFVLAYLWVWFFEPETL